MEHETLRIDKIPAIIWGKKSHKVIVAIHGSMSHKMDTPIAILAEVANAYGYQVLSFDLPEHGERKNEDTLCKVEPCMKDITSIMEYAKGNWSNISLFANSIGAYFSLLCCAHLELDHAWFLSPVVDMKRIIENMMTWFHVSKGQLEKEQTVSTPIGQTLYWDYYCYVKAHPINSWTIPTSILYGKMDTTCEEDTILTFAHRFPCQVEIVEDAEHYFHTPTQLQIFHDWLEKNISRIQ